MRSAIVTLFCLLLLVFGASPGCARQSEPTGPTRVEDLPGRYRDSANHDKPDLNDFYIKNEHNEWWLANDTEAVHMRLMARTEVADLLGREAAAESICLEAYDGAMRMIFCAAAPGVKAEVRVDHLVEEPTKFTSQTGYFAYIKYLGVWDLEKLE